MLQYQARILMHLKELIYKHLALNTHQIFFQIFYFLLIFDLILPLHQHFIALSFVRKLLVA